MQLILLGFWRENEISFHIFFKKIKQAKHQNERSANEVKQWTSEVEETEIHFGKILDISVDFSIWSRFGVDNFRFGVVPNGVHLFESFRPDFTFRISFD